MSMYPSLEDMKVDHMIKDATTPVQPAVGYQQVPSLTIQPSSVQYHTNTTSPYQSNDPSSYSQTAPYPNNTSPYPTNPSSPYPSNTTSPYPTNHESPYPTAPNPTSPYPSLNEFMGMELTEREIALNMPEYIQQGQVMTAPLSAGSVGLARAQVTHGVRQVIVCKSAKDKIGLRVKSINKGVFVALVTKGSPAALAGLRFGDQILQVNGENMAGFSSDKAHTILKNAKGGSITLAVRDRPFERTITLHKDSTGHIGFVFRDGKITDISVDSSAARNGLLINHHLLEVNGQNVVGSKDTDISKIIDNGENVITITIIPTFIYTHMIKNMSNSLMKKLMDHSIPEC